MAPRILVTDGLYLLQVKQILQLAFNQKEVRVLLDPKALTSNNWADSIAALYPKLKEEMQGTDGVVRRIKSSSEAARKTEIQLAMDPFKSLNDLSNLDLQIDQLASDFLRINNSFSSSIYYDHLSKIGDNSLNAGKPVTTSIANYLRRPDADPWTCPEKVESTN